MFDENLMDPLYIKGEMLSKVPTYIDNREGTFIYDSIAISANQFGYQYFMLKQLWESYFADTSAGEYLDKLGMEVGIIRKQGNKALGTLTLTGNGNVLINDEFKTIDGLTFISLEEKLINGADTIRIEAIEIGTKYNVKKGAIVSGGNWDKVENEEPTFGGMNLENDEELRQRILDRYAKPPASGCAHDYETWCKELEYIDYVKVLPLWNGNGTVKVIVGGEAGQPVESENLNECTAVVKSKAPIGANVTVVSTQLYSVAIEITGLEIKSGESMPVMTERVKQELTKYFDETVPDMHIRNLKLSAIIINTPGVVNYTSLKINGQTGDITITEDQKPYLTNVIFK